MDNEILSISLKCFFCDCELQKDSEKEFQSGDLIECQSCNEFNDYDSLIEVAKGEAESILKVRIQKELKSKFGNLFKRK